MTPRANGKSTMILSMVTEINELTEENQQLRKWCEEFNALEVAKENKKLKELLYSLKCCLTSENIEPQIRVEKSLAKINNAIGEK